MNLAIVHYHLNRGGVARVIENQLLALDAVLDPASPWRVAVLYGGRKHGWDEALAGRLRAINLRLVEVPGLDYDNVDESDELGGNKGNKGVGLDYDNAADGDPAVDDPGGMASLASPCSKTEKHAHASESMPPHFRDTLFLRLTDALKRLGFAPDQTVVQVHNHSLGKNVALSACVGALAEQGYPLLLQIHDFAEDFRPANYQRLSSLALDHLYPQAAGIHYAVLNGRDHAILQGAGTAADRLHLLPNPVPTLGQLPDRAAARKRLQATFDVGPDERYVLYPVRGIRRKNLGEAMLVGLLSPPGTVAGLTLPPLNPVEMPVYTAWKRVAAELNLPCRFEVGAPGGLDFKENLAAADAILTTSLAEGFGMVMLEPWPAGRVLTGRDLPEITADFTEAGLRLDHLWARLAVPLGWVGAEHFAERLAEAYRRAVAAYDWSPPTDWEAMLGAKIHDNEVDFGDLDESMQEDVLRAVLDARGGRQAVLKCNPGLEAILAVDARAATATIKHNVRVIEGQFSLVPSGRRLLELLLRVIDGPRGGPVGRLPRPERILGELLDPRRFRMIRG